MVGLVEACETDQNRAASQIAAYTGYLKGCHRGRGPTLFELAYRNADTIGSIKGYADASNLLLSAAPEFDLLRTTPLHGDLRTHSVKRKMSFSSGIGPQDSHRHDQILRTSPNTRSFHKRTQHPHESMARRSSSVLPPEAFPTQPPPSTSGNAPPASSVPLPSSKSSSAFVTLSSSSDDTEIVEPVHRPATRSQGGLQLPLQHDQRPLRPPHFTVTEAAVNIRSWHLRRTSNKGAGPSCNGSLRNTHAARDLCKNHIHGVGFYDRRGVVGIMVGGERHSGLNVWPGRLWFCPNTHCYQSKGNRSIGPLPPAPPQLPVAVGTNLSQEEIRFLLEQGLQIQGLRRHKTPFESPPEDFPTVPTHLDLRVIVDDFPEKVDVNNLDFRHSKRNNRVCQNRASDSSAHVSRVQSAKLQRMRILHEIPIHTGNGAGKQYLIATHEDDNLPPKRYWVQICCFPSCSCEDFYRRHTRGKSYQACKHILWVYKTVGGLDLPSSFIVKQPILTLREVQDLLGQPV